MKRFYSLLVLAFPMYITLSSCSKTKNENGDCGHGVANYDVKYITPSTTGISLEPFIGLPPTAGKVAYHYDDSVVSFIVGKNFNNICSKEHTYIYFKATAGGTPHTRTMAIFGDAYYGFASSVAILGGGILTPGAVLYSEPMEIGLSQQFSGKAADINVFLNVDFKTLGSLSQDSAYFAGHIDELEIYGEYSKHQ